MNSLTLSAVHVSASIRLPLWRLSLTDWLSVAPFKLLLLAFFWLCLIPDSCWLICALGQTLSQSEGDDGAERLFALRVLAQLSSRERSSNLMLLNIRSSFSCNVRISAANCRRLFWILLLWNLKLWALICKWKKEYYTFRNQCTVQTFILIKWSKTDELWWITVNFS